MNELSEIEINKIADEVNKKILDRTTYGMRDETPKKSGWMMSWSNASRNWSISYPVKQNVVCKLDANEIIVEHPKTTINQIRNKLVELPLYRNSFEFKYQIK